MLSARSTSPAFLRRPTTGGTRACRLATVVPAAVVVTHLSVVVTVQLVPRQESELAFADSTTEGILARTVVVVGKD